MKAVLITVCLITFNEVLSAPAARDDSTGVDDIEQELVRHHHSLNPGLQLQSDSIEQQGDSIDSIVPQDSSENVDLFDDESLYDFTVADVLADIIYELKKNPVLLEQLIESERQKVQRRLEEMSLARQDSYGDDLADFQKTAQQLDNTPMQVEKKAGRSAMETAPVHLEDKRADEVIDDNYARNDVSEEVRDLENFLNSPQGDSGDQVNANTNTEKDIQNNGGNLDNAEQGSNYDMYNWIRYLPKAPAQAVPSNQIISEKQTETNTQQDTKVE